MTLLTVNPQRKVRKPVSLFDNLFNEVMNSGFNELPKANVSAKRPAVNILETADNFRIDLAAPGLTKKDFSIDVEKDLLIIEANKEVSETDSEKWHRSEFDFDQFKRTFRLPEIIDTNNISANYKNGILKITLAKKETAKEQPPRAIKIK